MTKLIKPKKDEEKQLHTLLMDTAKPWLESEISPVVIGMIQTPSSHKNDPTYATFRMQYGSRAWDTGGYDIGSIKQNEKPEYKSKFEEIARHLRKSKWNVLASLFLNKRKPLPDKQVRSNIELVLYIEGGNIHFGVRNSKTKKEANFVITAEGFTSFTPTRTLWFQRYGYQTPIKVFPPQELANLPEKTNEAEVNQHVRWWFDTALQPEYEARDEIGALLAALYKRLSSLGKSVVIASSPHRFNDAVGDDLWIAVSVDGYTWENGAYFKNSSSQLMKAPREVNEAIGLVEQIKTCGFRNHFADYIGSSAVQHDTMVFSIDMRGFLIAFSSSVDEGGPVYQVDAETSLPRFIGLTPRLDWRFNRGSEVDDDGNQMIKSEDEIIEVIKIADWCAHYSQEEVSYLENWPELFPFN